MTCIVGLVMPDGIYVGGDSAGVGGYSLTVRADEKVFINSGFIFGFTSSFRMGQILRFGFAPPKLHADIDLYEYMVTTFVVCQPKWHTRLMTSDPPPVLS